MFQGVLGPVSLQTACLNLECCWKCETWVWVDLQLLRREDLLSGPPPLQLLRRVLPTSCPGLTPESDIPGIVVSTFALLVVCV